MQQEEQLAVADPGEAGPEAPVCTQVVFGPYRVLVEPPVLAVGGIGDQVVEAHSGPAVVHLGVAVIRQGVPEGDPLGVASALGLHEQVGLADREGFGVYLLPEEVDIGLRVHGPLAGLALAPLARGDVLLGDGEHAARAAAGVVDAAHHAAPAELALVTRHEQIDHQVDDVPGGKVLTRVLVQRLVELADQLLENRPHGGVVDGVRVEVHLGVAEALDDLKDQPRLVELADRVVEIEFLQHLAHVRTEADDVAAQIRGDERRVLYQPLEVAIGGVVEGEARGPAELRIQVLELALVLGVGPQDLRLGRGQHAVEPPQHSQRQDHVLVLPPLEGVADPIRHLPNKTHDLAVIHAPASPPREADLARQGERMIALPPDESLALAVAHSPHVARLLAGRAVPGGVAKAGVRGTGTLSRPAERQREARIG